MTDYYYETNRNPSVFKQRATNQANFGTLYQASNWASGASNWGTAHLYASRAICTEPTWRLALFEGFFPDTSRGVNACIDNLIDGPESISGLASLWEPQLVRRYQPDSLGYIWAALAPFLRAENADHEMSSDDDPSTPETPRRQRIRVVHQDTVLSDSFAIGSSPNRPMSASSGSVHSMGYTEALSAPLVEDATVRLASSFIRCVLNYAQPDDKQTPFLHYRDERLTHSYQPRVGQTIQAIDDGGVQLRDTMGDIFQVALLEGKRTFQLIEDGTPRVSDQVLAQLVGEALALGRSTTTRSFPNSLVIILATAHCVKFFGFEFTDDFMRNYETVPISDDNNDNFLQVHSTNWLSIKLSDHRDNIIRHLLAMTAWADATQS